MSEPRPALELFWHYRHPGIDPERVAEIASAAPARCLAAPGPHADDRPLTSLEMVEINFVDDPTIARIHADYLGDPTPTDVVTFPHGEVFISLDTAARAAGEHALPPSRETLLYLVHALLHLNGHHDSDPAEREAMHTVQDEILDTIWSV